MVVDGAWGRPFAITNRGWYLLHQFLKASGAAHTVHLMCDRQCFVPTRIAVQWGRCIESTAVGDWFLVGHFDGHSVVPSGIIHAREVDKVDVRCELTPLQGTSVYLWLLAIGQELSTAPSGYLISGKPRRGSVMSVSTTKGDKVDLAKAAADAGSPGLTSIRIGCGWDVRTSDGPDYDLDAYVVGCGADGKTLGDDWTVFYNHKESPGKTIFHHGDELTGAAEGDDEKIDVNLTALPDNLETLHIYVSIYEAAARGNQSFALVENAFVRVIDNDTNSELCRFDLSEDAGKVPTLYFGKVYRNNGTWAFKAFGDPVNKEIEGVLASHQ